MTIDQPKSALEHCRDALRRLTGAAFPVSTEIDSSGYAWSHAYLDSALPGARAALAAADAALSAQPEPDMRHPKIQRLIGAKARCEIELGLVEQLVEDPNFDATSMDMEYWGPLHDRLKSALEAAPVAQPLTDEQITACVIEAKCHGGAMRMAYESGPYSITQASINAIELTRAIERAHGIEPKEPA